MGHKPSGPPPAPPKREICKAHGKRLYKRVSEAESAAAQVSKRKGGHARYYPCSSGKGYHVTHLTEAEYQARREEWQT